MHRGAFFYEMCDFLTHSLIEPSPVTVSVPMSSGKLSRVMHLDARLLTHDQQETFGRVLHALNLTHAQTADGRHVDSAAQAMRWLIEQIASEHRAAAAGDS